MTFDQNKRDSLLILAISLGLFLAGASASWFTNGCRSSEPLKPGRPLAIPIPTDPGPTPTPRPTSGVPTPTPKPQGPPCSAHCIPGCYDPSLLGGRCAVGDTCVADCGAATPTPGPGTPTPTPRPSGWGEILDVQTQGNPELTHSSTIVSIGAQWAQAKPEDGYRFGWGCRAPNTGGMSCIQLGTPGQGNTILRGFAFRSAVKVAETETLFRLVWSQDGTMANPTILYFSHHPAVAPWYRWSGAGPTLAATLDPFPAATTAVGAEILLVYPMVFSGGYIFIAGDGASPGEINYGGAFEASAMLTIALPNRTFAAGYTQPASQTYSAVRGRR